MNADPGQPPLTHTLAYSYDPRDRITKVTKDGTTAEQYTHDANDNVTFQTIGTSPTTTFSIDRDRILTATTSGSTFSYNYDPFGRLDTITNPAGNPLEQNTYDGFDNITSHYQSSTGATTSYTYDPLNRMTSQTADSGGTPTQYSYLGLSGELTGEANTARRMGSEQRDPHRRRHRRSPWTVQRRKHSRRRLGDDRRPIGEILTGQCVSSVQGRKGVSYAASPGSSERRDLTRGTSTD